MTNLFDDFLRDLMTDNEQGKPAARRLAEDTPVKVTQCTDGSWSVEWKEQTAGWVIPTRIAARDAGGFDVFGDFIRMAQEGFQGPDQNKKPADKQVKFTIAKALKDSVNG